MKPLCTVLFLLVLPIRFYSQTPEPSSFLWDSNASLPAVDATTFDVTAGERRPAHAGKHRSRQHRVRPPQTPSAGRENHRALGG